MSFFNDPASCQASANPLNKFIDTSTNEQNSFGNFNNYQNLGNPDIQSIHRFQNIDTAVQRDFNDFSNTRNMQNAQLANEFNLHGNEIQQQLQYQQQHQQQLQHQQQYQQQESLHLQQNNNWASDFRSSEISLSQHQDQIHHFANQQQNSMNASRPYYMQSSRLQTPIMMVSSSQIQHQQQQQLKQQKQAAADLTELNNEFDSAFNELESDLVSSNQQAQNQQQNEEEEAKNTSNEEDKIKFAILAQNVFNLMNNTPKNVSSTTSDKFKQSGFMQLMNKISNREIEISNDKMKLVDQEGNDIRSDLSNPLANLNLNLESSFDSAIKVSKNVPVNVDMNSWQGDFS